MDNPNPKHPIITYFEAGGFMRRKAFITLAVSWFMFSILTALFVVQTLSQAGVDVTHLDKAPPMPLWSSLVILAATAALVPAVLMRARDAGWPPIIFVGIMAVHIFIKAINALTGGAIPEILDDVVQLAVYIMLIALALKPSNG